MNDRDSDLQQNISTGNGFANDQVATTVHLIKKNVIETRDLKELTKGVLEMEKKTTLSIDKLTFVIKSLDEKNGNLQTKLFVLSVITGILALAQLLAALLQLWRS